MVFSKFASGKRLRKPTAVLLSVAEFDQRLDVKAPRFRVHCSRLATEFRRKRVRIDVESYRLAKASAANLTVLDLPDLGGGHYLHELRRIPAMDRQEEFLMARRHECLIVLAETELVRGGFKKATASELVRKPLPEQLRTIDPTNPEAHKLSRKVDRAYVVQVLEQLAALRNLYVEGALHIVLTTVHRYRGLGVDVADLIQEGNASLFQAIDGFDWRRDVRFRTYAQYWVQQAVLKMLYNSSRTVRVPIWVQKLLGKIKRIQQAERRDGREVSHDEIGRKLGIPGEKVSWILATKRYAVSLDAETDNGEGASLAQMLPDDSAVAVPDSVPEGDLRESLHAAMQDLPERERSILNRRFGLDGQEPVTLGEIATDMGITAERVRQLQNAAISRLQKPAKIQQLKAFVEMV